MATCQEVFDHLRVFRFLNRGFAEPDPRNSPAFVGITEMYLITLFVFLQITLYHWNSKGNLPLIQQLLSSKVQSGVIDDTLALEIIGGCIIVGDFQSAVTVREGYAEIVTMTIYQQLKGHLVFVILYEVKALTDIYKMMFYGKFMAVHRTLPILAILCLHLLPELGTGAVSASPFLRNITLGLLKLFLESFKTSGLFKVVGINIVYLINLYHILFQISKNIRLAKGLLLTVLQPLAKTRPTVFTGLDATVFFQHTKPLHRSGFLLANLAKGNNGIADKDGRFGGVHIAQVADLLIKSL